MTAWRWAFPLLLLAAGDCIGVSQTNRTESAPGAVASAPALRKCRTDPKPAADGLLDDFEDSDTQLTKAGGRDGYWWPAKDNFGSTVEFQPDEGGAGGSATAL